MDQDPGKKCAKKCALNLDQNMLKFLVREPVNRSLYDISAAK